MTNPALTQTWATFIDMPEVVTYLQMDSAPTDAAAIKLQRLIDGACSQAQVSANRPFAPTQYQMRFDGWGGFQGAYIMLPYFPVLSVDSVVEWWGTSGPHTLELQTPESQGTSEMFQVEPSTGRLIRTFMGLVPRPFFPGSRNIEVIWTAGFNPIPPDVWLATIDLIAYWWRMTQESPRWFGRDNDQYGGPTTDMLYPGIPNRIADVFANYRVPTIG